MPEEDSFIEMPVWAVRHPRFAGIRGRHHVPTVGTPVHRKRWYSSKVRIRFLATGTSKWQSGVTDWATVEELITADTLSEARTLISWCLPDPRRQP
ncbi:hypothetical protein SSPS47_17270 [Streptomyces sp. S4.7]|uniref:hypothetical protein n=1 Tax=Streptomyces sp. S4.7 TaxID=2705439 RepID=UPI0013982B0E|nr:hypothetical protein [Streptomyces sp. S4.7]QHY96858.1 hypothetical protein SSPS47_17270 [Streptomyces sp. S4.7]